MNYNTAGGKAEKKKHKKTTSNRKIWRTKRKREKGAVKREAV